MSHSTAACPDEQATSLSAKKAEFRKTVTVAGSAEEARALLETLTSWDAARDFATVLACLPHGAEPDLTDYLRVCLARGQQIGLSRVEGDGLEFVWVSSLDQEWEQQKWGLKQPGAGPSWSLDLGTRTLVLVPGLAFAPGGGRLGRGGGYFDRFLALHPSVFALGYGYRSQVVPAVPLEPHDRPLDGLILGADSAILKAGVHLWH